MNLADPHEFEAAYRRLYSRVYASAMRVLRNPARAEEVAQEVFLRLWRNPGRFDPGRGELAPYLQLMARSRAIEIWRSDQTGERAGERLQALGERVEPPLEERPHAMAEHHSQRSILLDGLAGLPPAQREAVVLFYWGELTSEEIARHAGVPAGTAKSRVRVGLEKLRSSCGTALREAAYS